jgi:ribosome-associated protein
MEDVAVTTRLVIPGSEITETFARSGGPGGQHVNKTSTKVLLRWNVRKSRALGESDRIWLLEKLGPQLSRTGDVLVSSDRYRDQSRNRDDARQKLVTLLSRALERPKSRRRVAPPRRMAANRLRSKKLRSEVKNLRRRPED